MSLEFSREQPTRESLRKLTGAALDAFEPPSFHGCTKYRHCLVGNVCLSQRDGVLVPNVSGAASLAELDGGRDAKQRITLPWRARVLPMSHFRRLRNVYYAQGKTYAAGCWRQDFARRNPAHYMIGYGKLFAAAHDNRTHIVPRDIDHLVFHQCPPRAPEDWEWAQNMWSIIESESNSRGLWKPGKPNIITLGQPSVDVSQLPAKDDLVICAERMTIERVNLPTYLGVNHPSMVRHWHRAVEQRLHVNAAANTATPQSQNPGREGCTGCVNESRTALRIGIFRRTEGKSGLRRIRNLDEVQALAASFTRVPVKVFTLTSKSSFEEQLWAFRSLDLLITPHGSQLANMLFAPRTVFIELQAAGADVSFKVNGGRLVAGYILSLGHLPVEEASARQLKAQPCNIGVDRGLVRLMSTCFQGAWAKNCSFTDKRRLTNTDIFVNLTRLSADLATAVAIRCRSQSCVAKVPRDAPTPQSNPCQNARACWRPDGPVAKYSSACKARQAPRHALPVSQVVSRNPRAHLPPCRYEGRSLTFSPSSGLGNSLLAFASFAAWANLTRRRLAVQWAHGTNPSAQAAFDELFEPPPTSMAQTFVAGHMVHAPTCNPAPTSRCFIDARAQNWEAVQRLHAAPGFEGERWVACAAIFGVGNAYFVPMMSSHSSPLDFGPFSRRMLIPKLDAVRRANRFVSEQTAGGTAALIALHVRQSLISGRANRATGKWDSLSADPWPSSKLFTRCLADVRARASEAGYASSRIYVAADQVSVRERARQLLGERSVAPAHCGGRCTLPNDTGLAPQRTTTDVRAGLSELLVLARADALLVWNLRYSTYSAVAATWAAHRGAGQPLTRSRHWLGVWCVRCGCKRVRDEDVQPAMWGPLPGGNTTRQ